MWYGKKIDEVLTYASTINKLYMKNQTQIMEARQESLEFAIANSELIGKDIAKVTRTISKQEKKIEDLQVEIQEINYNLCKIFEIFENMLDILKKSTSIDEPESENCNFEQNSDEVLNV